MIPLWWIRGAPVAFGDVFHGAFVVGSGWVRVCLRGIPRMGAGYFHSASVMPPGCLHDTSVCLPGVPIVHPLWVYGASVVGSQDLYGACMVLLP